MLKRYWKISLLRTELPHSTGLARGFILWADIYICQGDDIQARAYLNNLQNNYKGDDEIAGMIEDIR